MRWTISSATKGIREIRGKSFRCQFFPRGRPSPAVSSHVNPANVTPFASASRTSLSHGRASIVATCYVNSTICFPVSQLPMARIIHPEPCRRSGGKRFAEGAERVDVRKLIWILTTVDYLANVLII